MFRNSALAVALVLSLGAVIQAAEEQIIVPDTTTQIGTVGATAGQIVVFNPSTNSYSLDSSLSIPGNPELDAVHRLDNPEQFLFSTRNPQASQGVDPDELPQVLNASVYHNDVIRYEGGYVWTPGGNPPPPGTYSFFFCNLSVPTLHRLPGGSNIDAVYLEPDGSMVVSLDAAATLGVNQIDYERWDLIRYKRSGGSGCGNWILDETAAPGGRAEVFDGNDLMDEAMNVVGATLSGDQIIMAINIQGHLQQSPTHNPYNPTVGEVATWDINTEQFSLTTTFASFPTTGTGGAYAQINSVAAPPVGCSALGSPNEGDTIVDMCGVTWVTEAQMRRFRMEWISMDGAFLYKVYRGGREDLCDGGITFSVVQQSTQTYYIENDDPAPVDAYYYLVTALTAQGEQPPGCANPAGCSGCCPRPLPPYPTTTPCP